MTQGAATFDSNTALTSLNDLDKGKKMLDKGVPAEANADGIIAWGRWTGGDSKINDASGNGKGKLATLHYFAFEATPTQPAVGTFISFASTAPTIQSGGQLVATGSPNGASGSFNSALLTATGGSATYSLTVPLPSETFTLTGTATQTSQFGFSGVSLITSTGQSCASGCTGSLGSNVSVIGLIGGAQGNRAGITYGFDSRVGNVSGVIVFKH
ncbi:MAG: hypothetical protein M3O01_11570 [Pseudomonadota bacterium]|nr:hypothetical protein [Pseudomonadota bacterium]